MTIATEVVPRITYTGTGSQTTFPYPWLILASSDLAVYQNGSLKTLGVHYSLSSVGAPTGGNVVFGLAPALGDSLVFIRDTDATQGTTLSDTGPAAMTAIERMADRLTMLVQEVKGALARAPLLSIFSGTQNPSLPDPSALKGLRWKSDLSGLENVDLTTILAASATLPLALTQGGTGATTALAARVALGLDGQVRKALTNLTGVTLNAGDVAALDTATDSTVVLGDTVSSKAQFVVALETITHTSTGTFLLSGIGPLNVQGACTRGRYVRKSATSLKAEDSGTLHGAATDPPQGSFAVALTGMAATGQITARLFGFTYPGSTAPVITNLYAMKGFGGGNSVTLPNSQFDVGADFVIVKDPSTSASLVLPGANKTVDVSVAGPIINGRDQAVAFSANSWLHLYWIAKTDGTLNTIASLNPPPTGPVLPAGYTLWAYMGAIRYNNSSQLVRTTLRGNQAMYDAHQALVAFTTGGNGTENIQAVSSLVPPNASHFTVDANILATGGSLGTDSLVVRHRSGQDTVILWNAAAATGERVGKIVRMPNTGIFAWVLTYASVSPQMSLDVLSYEMPN